MWDAKNIILFFTALINIYLGIIIYRRGKKNASNISYSFVTYSVAAWALGMFFFRGLIDEKWIEFFARSLYFSAAFIAGTFLYFSYIFPKRELIVKKLKAFLIFGPVVILSLLVFFTELIVKQIVLDVAPRELVFGHLYLLYAAYIAGAFILAFKKLLVSFIKARGTLRIHSRYIFIGTIISAVVGIFTNLIFSGLGYFVLFWLGPISPMAMVVFFVYGIIRYRLMDIRLVITRSFLYSIMILAVSALFAGSVYSLGLLTDVSSGRNQLLVTLGASVIIVLFLEPFKRFLSKITDRIFFKGQIDYDELLTELSKDISEELDLHNLIEYLEASLTKKLKIAKAQILIRNAKGDFFSNLIKKDNLVKLETAKSKLVSFLKEHPELLITEELERKLEDERDIKLQKVYTSVLRELKKYKIATAVSIFYEQKLSAVLVLGEKVSGDVTSMREIKFLEIICSQLGTAIEKAKLYNEVKDFNIALQRRIKAATRNLRKSNVSLKERNKFLETLQNITEKITRSLNFKEVTQYIADSIHTELGNIGGILMFTTKQKRLKVGAISKNMINQDTADIMPKKASVYRLSLKADNLTAKAVKTGRIQKGKNFAKFITPPVSERVVDKLQKYFAVESIIAVPIFSEENVIGVIDFVLPKALNQVSIIEIEMMKALADQVGIVARNLQLYEKLQESNIQLKEANIHLQQLDKAKSEFLSIAAHQLRTPLTGIKGYLSMFLEGDFGEFSRRQHSTLQELLDNTNRLTRLVNVFLNVSRIESDRLKLSFTKIDLNEIAEKVIRELKGNADKKKLELTFKPAEGKALVLADQDKIHDIFINLIDNAIKYTDHGKVEVKIIIRSSRVRCEIRDTGMGVDHNEALRLFNKFSRGDRVRAVDTSGSGLGLYVVRKIIEAHKGKVGIKSKGAGLGSTFWFELAKR